MQWYLIYLLLSFINSLLYLVKRLRIKIFFYNFLAMKNNLPIASNFSQHLLNIYLTNFWTFLIFLYGVKKTSLQFTVHIYIFSNAKIYDNVFQIDKGSNKKEDECKLWIWLETIYNESRIIDYFICLKLVMKKGFFSSYLTNIYKRKGEFGDGCLEDLF